MDSSTSSEQDAIKDIWLDEFFDAMDVIEDLIVTHPYVSMVSIQTKQSRFKEEIGEWKSAEVFAHKFIKVLKKDE